MAKYFANVIDEINERLAAGEERLAKSREIIGEEKFNQAIQKAHQTFDFPRPMSFAFLNKKEEVYVPDWAKPLDK